MPVLDTSRDDSPDRARQLTWRVRRVALAANALGALVVFFALALVGSAPGDLGSERSTELVLLFGAYLMLSAVPISVFLGRAARPFVHAIASGGPITGAARRELLRSPWLNAIVSLSAWVGAAVVFPLHAGLRLGATSAEAVQLAVDILLGGFTTMALVYLLVERAVRPAVALAFRAAPPTEVRGVAVRPRLLLSWLLGGGVPLLLVGSLLLDSGSARVDFPSFQRVGLTFVAAGLLAGTVITSRVARSVAEPLGSVREAMDSVRRGRFDVSVEVDDATEVGLLQVGFNHMVTGLRERERLRDLFGRHVGTDVAAQAFERGVELGGEIRDASVLFVDLVGSTGLAATRPPQEVVALLNDFFTAVVEATGGEGGWVDKFEGDAALCVFGAPAEQTDHAARALGAARDLASRLAELRAAVPELDAGIGVSSGRVVAGNVGTEERYEYTVIGDPVNEAARLSDEAKTRPGRVLAAERTVHALGGDSGAERWREAAVFELRGRPEPTRAFEVR